MLQSENELPVNRAVMETYAQLHGLGSLFTPQFMESLVYDNFGQNVPYEVIDMIQDEGAGSQAVYDAIMAYWEERNG